MGIEEGGVGEESDGVASCRVQSQIEVSANDVEATLACC
jgi:hypothetical protein